MNKLFLNTLPPGEKLQNGKYIIIEIFGQGYFSITYLATQSILNKRLIIHEFFLRDHCLRTGDGKVVNEKLEKTIYEKFSNQWFEEAKTLARCSSNEHIVSILDTFKENDTIYYVTEFINEEDLQSFTLAQIEHRLTEDQALDFTLQVANGLSFLHQNAIFHLDLSPAKILIDKNKKAVITSFGIARQNIPPEILRDTIQLTKASYSPPEFYLPDGKYDIFSDLYSLGAILYFMVTGKDPVPAPERISASLPEPKSLNPSVSAQTNRAIMKALNMGPEKRQQRVNDFVKDLPQSGKSRRPWKKLTIAAIATSLMLIVILIAILRIIPSSKIDTEEIVNQYRTDLAKYTFSGDKIRGAVLLKDSLTDQSLNVGKFYALLIGIKTYDDPQWGALTEPINDVNALKEVLVNDYTFDKVNVTILPDPTLKKIFQVLNYYRDSLTPEDNLLVFYAGHGFYIEKDKMGYLIPKDAARNNEAGWLSFQEIKQKFGAMEAKHVLFIADACYAGSVFRGGNAIHPQVIERISSRSRTAFTSADLKPVPDHSDFLKHLISNLKNNRAHILLSEDLYIRTRSTLIQGTSKKDPVRWGPLDCGDEGGDFIFVRRVYSIK